MSTFKNFTYADHPGWEVKITSYPDGHVTREARNDSKSAFFEIETPLDGSGRKLHGCMNQDRGGWTTIPLQVLSGLFFGIELGNCR